MKLSPTFGVPYTPIHTDDVHGSLFQCILLLLSIPGLLLDFPKFRF